MLRPKQGQTPLQNCVLIMASNVSEEDTYRSDLDGLGQGQLGNGCGCRSRDVGPIGAVLLAGRVHGSSQNLGLGLLDQQLLLRGQGQLQMRMDGQRDTADTRVHQGEKTGRNMIKDDKKMISGSTNMP